MLVLRGCEWARSAVGSGFGAGADTQVSFLRYRFAVADCGGWVRANVGEPWGEGGECIRQSIAQLRFSTTCYGWNCPGSDCGCNSELYYLDVMAGPMRKWRFKNHPDHERVIGCEID